MSTSRTKQVSGTAAPLRYTRANPPGRAALAYSGARYLDAVRRMLARLPAQVIADTCSAAPLAALNRDTHDDWSIALIHAWAVVADVLTFYQERITNEGYLRTATEYRSVLELARTIGYELQPGLAASTYLAFTVLTIKGEPPRQVLIPPATAIQSIPGQGQLPQVFETSAKFLARAEWNALRPGLSLDGPPRAFGQYATSLRLAGTSTGLRPNDTILIVDSTPPSGAGPRAWRLATLTTVAADAQRGYTTIGWEAQASAPIRAPIIFALSAPAALLTHPQSSVYYSDSAPPAWAPTAIGLPKAAVHALSVNAAGKLFAGTEKDLFSSVDQGASWQPANLALVQKDCRALAIDADQIIYAGAKDGAIFLSKDQGVSWVAMSGDSLPPPPARRLKLPGPASGPLPKTVVRALAAYDGTLAAATDDGVLRSTDRGKTWAASNADIPKTDPKTGLTPVVAWSLAVAKQSELFAGTDAGVFHIQGQASTLAVGAVIPGAALLGGWLLKDIGKGTLPLDKLIEAGKGLLKSGKDLLSKALDSLATAPKPFDALQPPLDALKKSLVGLITPVIGYVTARIKDLAALVVGLPMVGPLIAKYFAPALSVLIIAALVLAALLAARRLANRYLGARATFSLAQPVHALVAAKNGRLFAGTAQGIFRSNDGDEQQGSRAQQIWRGMLKAAQGDLARRWQPANSGLGSLDVRALAIDDQGALLAGTQDGLVFRSTDDGATWAAISAGLTLKSVLAINPVAGGYYAAGTPIDRAAESAWPRDALLHRWLDLDRAYPAFAAGQWVVLCQPGVQPALYQADSVALADSQEVLRPGQFTRITLDTAARLVDFDRRGAAALLQGAPLALYDDSPIQGDILVFDSFVPGLDTGHALIVGGKRIRARLAPYVASGAVLRSADGLLAAVVQPGELLQVLAPPQTGADGTLGWMLRSRDGMVGTLNASADALIWEPANDDDEVVSELALVKLVLSDATRTTVMFQAPLANLYDRSTVTIYGNVVHATHGETVENELLGSSDSMSTNQQFLLKQPPLTYLPAASSAGIASTLTVKVNGVRWEEVPFLHQRARNRRAYMLRQDAASGPPVIPDPAPSGTAAQPPSFPSLAVIFGDGTNGAGLPTGTWKIEATYRSGLGRQGNVGPGSLSVLQTAVRGIKGVTNPIAAAGGIDPQRMDDARQKAPQTLRAMQRIVSVTDFEDFARNFPGVGKVQAGLIGHGRSRIMHLTIGDADGNVIDKASDLYKNLVGDINKYRATPVPPVYIDSFVPRYFNLRARLLIAPEHLGRADAIKDQIRQALSDEFAYIRRDFGQSVAAAEVINVIQQIQGVVALELMRLHIHDEPDVLQPLLEAMPVRWVGSRLAPAEMLLLNTVSKDGIQLELQDD